MSTPVTTPALDLALLDQKTLNQQILDAQTYAEEHARRLTLAVEVYEANGIASEIDMERANEVLTQIVAMRKGVDEKWDAPVAFFNKAHKTLTGWRKRGTDLFDKLRTRIEVPMKAFIRTKEEADRKRQEEAEKAAAELKKRQLAEARRLAREGDMAGAREAKEMAQAIVPPALPATQVNLGENSTRRSWKIEIVNRMALVKAISEGKAPITFIKEFNETEIKRAAARGGVEGEIYPGVKAWEDIGFSVRT